MALFSGFKGGNLFSACPYVFFMVVKALNLQR